MRLRGFFGAIRPNSSLRSEHHSRLRARLSTVSPPIPDSAYPFLKDEIAEFAKLSPRIFRLLRLIGVSGPDEGSDGLAAKLAISFGEEMLEEIRGGHDVNVLQSWNLDLKNPTRELVRRSVASRFLHWTLRRQQDFSPALKERVLKLIEISDLTRPVDLFIGARRTKRHVHLHVGPTNSGKTYNALLALANSESGVYAGPLRLLAHEVAMRFNEGGIVDRQGTSIKKTCNLVTGEVVRILDENAPLTACTIEMLQATASKLYDVAVIDEIQMIDDPQRGVAWTAAFLGLSANEVHLCGEERSIEVIQKLCGLTNDSLSIHRYERLTPLEVADHGLGSNIANLQKGDCLVAFSKYKIFALQADVRRNSTLKVAVVYGSLPPEVRSSQAYKFNSGEADVLIGSDAIGMGLNLKIKRVIFETLFKYGDVAVGGKRVHRLSNATIGQIAGRAGRYGMGRNVGLVTTLRDRDLPELKDAMASSSVAIETAKISPTEERLRQMASILPSGSIGDAYEVFRMIGKTDNRVFQLPSFEDFEALARLVESFIDVPFVEGLVLAQSPLSSANPVLIDIFISWMEVLQQRGWLDLKRWLQDSGAGETMQTIQDYVNACDADHTHRARHVDFFASKDPLQICENFHRLMMIYRWLSYRLEYQFPDGLLAEQLAQIGQAQLDWFLMDRVSQDKVTIDTALRTTRHPSDRPTRRKP